MCGQPGDIPVSAAYSGQLLLASEKATEHGQPTVLRDCLADTPQLPLQESHHRHPGRPGQPLGKQSLWLGKSRVAKPSLKVASQEMVQFSGGGALTYSPCWGRST